MRTRKHFSKKYTLIKKKEQIESTFFGFFEEVHLKDNRVIFFIQNSNLLSMKV